MRLVYTPGACSLGIHIVLEEIGAPYELERLNLAEGAQHKPPFTSINPKSKVPTLVRDDGSVLTEFPAIAYWLAAMNPGAKLWPEGTDDQARALEAMDYAVATVHMQGFTRIVRPGNFTPNAVDEEAVKARGHDLFTKGLNILDAGLAGRDYVAGAFSVGDAAVFYVEWWAAGRLKMALPSNCDAHYRRMLARPTVQRTMQQEGLSP